MAYRYYSTQRPVQIGGYPAREHVMEIYNFDNQEYCEGIGRKAWGYIDYDTPLAPEDAYRYELVLSEQKNKYSVAIRKYGYVTVEAKSIEEAKDLAYEVDDKEIDWDPDLEVGTATVVEE